MVPAVFSAWNRRIQGLEPSSPRFGTVVSRVWNRCLQGLEPSYPGLGTFISFAQNCLDARAKIVQKYVNHLKIPFFSSPL